MNIIEIKQKLEHVINLLDGVEVPGHMNRKLLVFAVDKLIEIGNNLNEEPPEVESEEQ